MKHSNNPDNALLYKKIGRRIVPFLVICFIVSFLDRVNISYAKFQLAQDLGFSDAIYGLGAGIFAFGYVLFEVPSNLMMGRFGARRTFVRIMIGWGLVSMSMMFVTQPWHFYALRFLLGVFEAGFYPGLMLYLSLWFPPSRYAGAVSWFIAGSSVAGLIGGPASGWIMRDMAGVANLHGWQWLFLLEALPAVVLGVIANFLIADEPKAAKWLNDAERATLADDLMSERPSDTPQQSHSFGHALRNPLIYIFAAIYFSINYTTYGLTLWLPSIIAASGVKSVFDIGLYSAIPNAIGAVGIVLLCRHSDRTRERRWHLFACSLVGAMALLTMTFAQNQTALTLVALSVAVVVTYSLVPLFWSTPPAFLVGSAAAGGLAFISSIGQLAGFASPYVMGLTKTETGSFSTGLALTAAILTAGGLALAFVVPWHTVSRRSSREASAGKTA